MQFRVFEKDIEVNAPTVNSIVAGLGYFTNLSKRYLSREKIGKIVNKQLVLDSGEWYSQAAWLRAFENIAQQIGDKVLFKIGLSIPENAVFPPFVVDIDTAVQSIDIAYHINHRKNGRELFNMETGVMYEGIGHYGYERLPGQNKIISVSRNPYPCAFDRGIITAMARKFQSGAAVVHDDSKECRKDGRETCTYIVTW
ncbi:MAG: hypothetical protein LBQ88_15205 [Treponema sp.]|jgi:hypothetical protein|nr:hypothetical protein [Treponema sp.]